MHQDSKDFMESVRLRFPSYFKGVRVLDCGSYDVNGNNKYLFEDCDYVGLDLAPGKNVDVVSKISDYRPDLKFHTVISTNCFEHDAEWRDSIPHAASLLEPKGLFVFSCSGHGTKEHGTKQCSPEASLSSDIWEYYCNLSEEDVRSVLDMRIFHTYEFNLHTRRKGMGTDLQFWGMLL